MMLHVNGLHHKNYMEDLDSSKIIQSLWRSRIKYLGSRNFANLTLQRRNYLP